MPEPILQIHEAPPSTYFHWETQPGRRITVEITGPIEKEDAREIVDFLRLLIRKIDQTTYTSPVASLAVPETREGRTP